MILKVINNQGSTGTAIRTDSGARAAVGSRRPALVPGTNPVVPVVPGSWRGAGVVGVDGSGVGLQLV